MIKVVLCKKSDKSCEPTRTSEVNRCSPPDRAVWVRALVGDTVVFLGKTLNFHGASLHPGVFMDTGGDLNAGGIPAMD